MKKLILCFAILIAIAGFSAIASPAQNSTDKPTNSGVVAPTPTPTPAGDETVTIKATTAQTCAVAIQTVEALKAELAIADATADRLRRALAEINQNADATIKAKDAEIAELRKALIEIVKSASRRSKICLIC